jgi:hypothetical protein
LVAKGARPQLFAPVDSVTGWIRDRTCAHLGVAGGTGEFFFEHRLVHFLEVPVARQTLLYPFGQHKYLAAILRLAEDQWRRKRSAAQSE